MTCFPHFDFNTAHQRIVERLRGRINWFEYAGFSVLKLSLEQMKPKAKKYLITEESHEILVVRRKGRAPSRVHCSQCGTEPKCLPRTRR